MQQQLAWAIYVIGYLQLGVLIAALQLPFRLRWHAELAGLPRLHRQLFWSYAVFVALGIVSLALICIVNSTALASGTPLARGVCIYGAVFWCFRLALQAVFEARRYLTSTGLRLTYHLLTVLFAGFTVVYGLAAFLPR